MRPKGDNRWRRIRPRPDMDGYTEADLAERIEDDQVRRLTPREQAAIEEYARHFDQEPRPSPRGGRPPRLSDAAAVRIFLGAAVRKIGRKRLAKIRGGKASATHWAYRKGLRLVREAVASGLFGEPGR